MPSVVPDSSRVHASEAGPCASCRCLGTVHAPRVTPFPVLRVDASQTGPCASCRTIPGSGFLLLAIRYKFELHLLAQQR